MKTVFRYYSPYRPLGPGTIPKRGIEEIVNFDDKEYAPAIGRQAWGYVDYNRELTPSEQDNYELVFDTEYIDPEIHIGI